MTQGWKVLLGTMVTALAVSACATSQLSRGPGTVSLATRSQGRPMGRAELWAAHCARCHNLRQRTEFSPAQWAVVVNHMRVVADLPGKDYRALLEYLADRTPDVLGEPKIAATSGATPRPRE